MADRRTYIRVHDGFPDHPKLIKAGAILGRDGGAGMAGWLAQCAWAWSARQTTDGEIPVGLIGRLTDFSNEEAIASALLRVGLWHEANHDCPTCPQGEPGTYVIHDYLEHQRSAAEIKELSEKRRAAGQRGGKASGIVRGGEAKTEASASAKPKQTRSKTQADTETDTERDKEQKKTPRSAPPTRVDVERICGHLANKIEGNGNTRPTINDDWRNQARLMLDRDKRTVEQVIAAIDWCQSNDFWRKNVMSMPKLRIRFDRLRMDAIDEQKQRKAAHNRLAGADSRDGSTDWSDPKAMEF